MKKLPIVLGVGFGGLLLVLVAVAVVAFVFIDEIAKRGVEEGATYALDVPTTLGSADVGVLSGRFDMSSLTVSNPPGFSSPHFLALSEGGVAVSFASLREPTVELPELTLEGIDVNLQRAEGESNYSVLLENLRRHEAGETDEPAPESEGKKFIVRELTLRDITVNLDLLPIGGEATKLTIDIPEIAMTDVGSDGGGVPMGELTGIVLKAVLTAVAQKAGGLVPGDLLGDLTSGLSALTSLQGMGIGFDPSQIDGTIEDIGGTLGDAASDAIDSARDAADQAIEDAADEVRDGLQRGLDGILGGGSDDDGG